MFVIDAATCGVERDASTGKITELMVMDGATITRYLTTRGTTPKLNPNCSDPAHNQLGQAQNVKYDKDTLIPDKQPQVCGCAAFTQYLYGINAINLTVRDIIYKPFNTRADQMYGYSAVEQIMLYVNIMLNRQMSQLGFYTVGNVPEFLAFMPYGTTQDQIKEFETWFNSVEQGNVTYQRRARFLPTPSPNGEPAFHQTKNEMLKDEFDDWIARIYCYAFNVPPTALQKMTNRATAQQNSEDVEESGLTPVLVWIQSFMNDIIQNPLFMNLPDYSFTFQERPEPDALKQAQIFGVYVDKGIMSRNEVRIELGLDEDSEPLADDLCVTSNMGPIPLSKGPDLVNQLANNNKHDDTEEENTTLATGNPSENNIKKAHDAQVGPHLATSHLTPDTQIAIHSITQDINSIFDKCKKKAINELAGYNEKK